MSVVNFTLVCESERSSRDSESVSDQPSKWSALLDGLSALGASVKPAVLIKEPPNVSSFQLEKIVFKV